MVTKVHCVLQARTAGSVLTTLSGLYRLVTVMSNLVRNHIDLLIVSAYLNEQGEYNLWSIAASRLSKPFASIPL